MFEFTNYKTKHVAYLERIIKDKNDLEQGDVVTLRNGDKLVYLGDESFADLGDENDNYVSDFEDLNDDLSYTDRWNDKPDYDYDIVKVERPATYYTAFEREDKAREMTIKEISEKLGYEVKVVKEK